jgi:hypothetical protein
MEAAAAWSGQVILAEMLHLHSNPPKCGDLPPAELQRIDTAPGDVQNSAAGAPRMGSRCPCGSIASGLPADDIKTARRERLRIQAPPPA